MKSSNEGGGPAEERPQGDDLVPVAAGLRLRGARGRLTASLVPGGIDQLRGRASIWIGEQGKAASRREIETYAVYGRKVVVKLRGVDTAAEASRYVGMDILMPCNGLVDLPEGAYYIFELVGMRVRTRMGRDLGTVRRVIETGGAPLLVIAVTGTGGGVDEERLVPVAQSICTGIDKAAGTITIDPPDGLLEL